METGRQIDSTTHELKMVIRTLEAREGPSGINPRSLWRKGARQLYDCKNPDR